MYHYGAIGAAILALGVTGCATSPDRPVEALANAKAGIEMAEQNGARAYSGEALDTARNKLRDAQRAAENGDTAEAKRLARQSELDAELAIARTGRVKAEESLAELQKSLQTLREESMRGMRD